MSSNAWHTCAAVARSALTAGGLLYFLGSQWDLVAPGTEGDLLGARYDGRPYWETVSFPASDGAPTGAIVNHAGTTAPAGWLLCEGQPVSRTTYADLFNVISTTFGIGDGSLTFNVPDFRGAFARGVSTTYARGAMPADATKRPSGMTITAHSSHKHTDNSVSANHSHSNNTSSHSHQDSMYDSGTHAHTGVYEPYQASNLNAGIYGNFGTASTNTQTAPETVTSGVAFSNHTHTSNSVTHSHTSQTSSGTNHRHQLASAHAHSHGFDYGGDLESRPPNVYMKFIIKT